MARMSPFGPAALVYALLLLSITLLQRQSQSFANQEWKTMKSHKCKAA